MIFADFVLLRRRFVWWATAVLLLAAIFRLVLIRDVPPGLAQDEVLNADIALFIRQGQHAFFFREGYGHEPLYHYLAVPLQVLLGDNILSIRLPAVYLGLMLVALLLRWTRREWGALVALVGGGGVAVSWWPIIFSRIGLRPILEPVLLLLAAWFWKRPFLAGLILGLSFYSYTGARIVFLLPLGYALIQRLAGRRLIGDYVWWRWLAITMGVFALVAAPMQVTLWRDPTLQQRVDQLAGPLDALREGDAGPIWDTAVATLGFISFTGDPRWTYTLPGIPLFDWGTAVIFYAGLVLALWRWRDERMSLLLVWLAVALIPSAITPQAPSIVRLIGAIPPVFLFPGLALAWLAGRLAVDKPKSQARAKLLSALFGLTLCGLLLLNGGRTIQNGFITWPRALETRLKYQTALRDIGDHIQAHKPERIVVADSFFEPIDADSLRRMGNLSASVRWVQTGGGLAGALVLPGGVGNGRLYVPEYAPLPMELLAAVGIAAEPLYRSDGSPSFAVYALPPVPETAVSPPLVTFAGRLRLLDFKVMPAQDGEARELLTWWYVERPLPADLASFVHLLNAQGELVSQHDGWDAAAHLLQPGDVVVQRHLLPVPPTAGEYTLQVGLYERGSSQRWLHDSPPTDHFTLTPLHIDGK